MSGKPNVPSIKGQDHFEGEQQHSSQHPGPDGYQGKKVVVIGSNNSAHDICAALCEAGVDVTMVQRSSTHIVRSEPLMKHGLGALYSEEAVQNGITTAKADLIFASLPYRIMHEFQIPIYDRIREIDADFYSALEKLASNSILVPMDRGCFSNICDAGPATISILVLPSSSLTARSSLLRGKLMRSQTTVSDLSTARNCRPI